MNKLLLLPLLSTMATACEQRIERPNVIIIFADDQGYEDLGCYGSPDIATPNIDALAQEGLRLTNFYVSASVSSASRAGLLTGRLNCHNGVKGVYFPDKPGMPLDERTLADELREVGYATGCFGKWHLGDLEGYLPTSRGFDEFYGMPYSNDMFIGHTHKFAKDVEFREGFNMELALEAQAFNRSDAHNNLKKARDNFAMPIFEGTEIVEYPAEQETTTRRYFDRAIDFIERNRTAQRPFFAYITPAMPHYPIRVSEEFRGRSKDGLYGDAVEEIDHNVGRLMAYLREHDLEHNTIVIYSSDNGPWLGLGEESGSAGELRDGKFSSYEGGVRVPFIIRWSGTFAANKLSDEIVASIDLFPTIMRYAGKECFEQQIDGVDQSHFFVRGQGESARDEYLYVKGGKIFGLRHKNWVYLPSTGERFTPKDPSPELYDLSRDGGQQVNLYSEQPEKAAELAAQMEKYNN